MVKVLFSVDDVCPKPGYGLFLNNDPTKYLLDLNKEFGAKFTLFCIPLMEGNEQYSWLNNKEWSKQISSLDAFEIAAHGLTHQATKKEYGAQEFIGLNPQQAHDRIIVGKQIIEKSINKPVKGFKAPGWYISPFMYDIIKNNDFLYVADHFVGREPIMHNGIYRIPYTYSIEDLSYTHLGDTIIFHSHISMNDGNKNGWNKELYNKVREVLLQIENPEFITFSELIQ